MYLYIIISDNFFKFYIPQNNATKISVLHMTATFRTKEVARFFSAASHLRKMGGTNLNFHNFILEAQNVSKSETPLVEKTSIRSKDKCFFRLPKVNASFILLLPLFLRDKMLKCLTWKKEHENRFYYRFFTFLWMESMLVIFWFKYNYPHK